MRLCVMCNRMTVEPERKTYAHGWIRILTGQHVYDVCPKCAEPIMKTVKRVR